MGNTRDIRIIEIVSDGSKAQDTIKQLSAAARKLRSELRDLSPTSQEFIDKTKRLSEVNSRLTQLNGTIKNSAAAWERFKREAQTVLLGVVGGGLMLGAVQQMSSFITDAVSHAAKLSDALADVRKTTDLSAEGVRELASALSKIDTRTSRNELLSLAKIAGKLGITEQEDILGFVRAMDKVNVALGEDLGNAEDVSRTLGKLVNLFNLTKNFSIEESLTRVGSVLNDLGKSSEASEGNIVELTKRLGGIAPLADISIQNIMALAATLDANGQSAEMSGTAIQNFLIKMAEKSEVFSQFSYDINGAQNSAEQFTQLLRNDTFGALLSIIRGLKSSGSNIVELSGSLDQLGIDGARTTGVLAVMANNYDMLVEQMAIADAAFIKNSSIQDEYNIKNQNYSARLEKSTKALQKTLAPVRMAIGDMAIAFIEFFTKAIPVLITVTKTLFLGVAAWTTYKVVTLASAISIGKFNVATRTSTILLAIHRTATHASAMAVAFFSGNIAKARVEYAALSVALKANPFGLLITAITSAGIALSLFKKEASATQESIQQSVAAGKTQADQILAFNKILSDQTRTLQDRKAAIKELRSLTGDFLQNLSDEALLQNQAANSIREYAKSVQFSSYHQAYELLLQDKNIERTKKITELLKIKNSLTQAPAWIEAKSKAKQREIDQLDLEIEKISKLAATQKLLANAAIPPGSNNLTPEQIAAAKAAQEEAEKEAERKRKEAIEHAKKVVEAEADMIKKIRQYKIDAIQDEREQALQQLQFEYETKQQEVHDSLAHEETKTNALSALQERYQVQRAKLVAEYDKKIADKSLEEDEKNLNRFYAQQILHASQLHAANKTSQDEYEDSVQQTTLNHLESLKQLYLHYGKDVTDIEQEIADYIINNLKTVRDAHTSNTQYILALKQQELEALDSTSDEALQIELEMLQLRMQQELEMEELTAEQKLLIQKKYELAQEQMIQQHREKQLEQAADLANDVTETYMNFLQIQENNALKSARRKKDKEIGELNAQFQANLISKEDFERRKQSIESRYEDKAAQLKRQQFERQKAADTISAIIATALAVAKALPNIPLSIIAGAAGAAQIGVIQSQPTPEFALGGILNGPSHAQGGIPLVSASGNFYGNAEGGEIILTKAVAEHPVGRQIASNLNEYFGGVRFDGVNYSRPAPLNINTLSSRSSDPTTISNPSVLSSEASSLSAAVNLLLRRLERPIVSVISHNELTDYQNDLNRIKGYSKVS